MTVDFEKYITLWLRFFNLVYLFYLEQCEKYDETYKYDNSSHAEYLLTPQNEFSFKWCECPKY